MQLQLKKLHTLEGETLESAAIGGARNFNISLHMTIGIEGQAGGDNFTVCVCSPDDLSAEVGAKGTLSGRHRLILNSYDPISIKIALEKIIQKCTRDTFSESAQILSRYFSWEFEDYKTN